MSHFHAAYSLASLINLLGVFRCGCGIGGCRKRDYFSYKSTYKSNITVHCLEPSLFLFVPEWPYELIESPHGWDPAPLSALDCSCSPVATHEMSINYSNIFDIMSLWFLNIFYWPGSIWAVDRAEYEFSCSDEPKTASGLPSSPKSLKEQKKCYCN